MNKLTPKQEVFVREYLVDLNATQAAIRAGYSAKNAQKIGSQLLDKTRVVEAIQEHMEKRAEKVEWTAEQIMRDIKDIAENPQNEVRDRLKAYELAGKHLKMWTERVEQSGNIQITLEGDVKEWAK